MDSKSNTLRLDFRDNPELQALLGGLSPGDRVTLELDLMAKSVDSESFEAVVENISVEGEETETEEGETTSASGEVEPTSDEPVMIVMASKAKKSKAADEGEE